MQERNCISRSGFSGIGFTSWLSPIVEKEMGQGLRNPVPIATATSWAVQGMPANTGKFAAATHHGISTDAGVNRYTHFPAGTLEQPLGYLIRPWQGQGLLVDQHPSQLAQHLGFALGFTIQKTGE
jgi:hypothetical protein